MKNALLKKALHWLLAAVTVIALAMPLAAQQQNSSKPAANPLVRLLQSKGILTDEEAAQVNQAATPSEADQRLARLLLSKGLITQQDYDQTVGAAVVPTVGEGSGEARVVPAVLRVPISSPGTAATAAAAPEPQAPKPPAVVPAIAPIRVLQSEPTKREGLIPDLKLGPVRLKPYGFFKTSVVYDSSSGGGNDFPLPAFIAGFTGGTGGDTGPDASPEFHIKARAFRIGSNFEWIDPSPNVAVTGRFELDFEGNFTRVANRNISTIRSSQPSIRLAWGRVDYAASDKTTVFALFGQDWTPFGSSTLPNLLETTGLGLGFGTLYERAPQARFGFNYNFGGAAKFKLQPEFGVVLPSFGNAPSLIDNQLGFGERQGTDSGRPEVQGRIVAQFQLDNTPGVAPAQIIASFMQGQRRAIVLRSAIPCVDGSVVTTCPTTSPAPANNNAFRDAFPRGVRVGNDRFGYTAEAQLPTRWFTLIGKYYNGEDLRFYFAGQLFSNYNDTGGLTGVVSPAAGNSIDGSSSVLFGFNSSGAAVFAPQRPVRSQGGFVNLGIPLSRIAGADAAGRNAGWSLYLHYAIDFAKARDVRRFTAAGTGSRVKGDLGAATLYYKLNNWVTFAVEESYYRTRAISGTTPAGAPILFPLFQGVRSREAHDFRSEFGTIFTF